MIIIVPIVVMKVTTCIVDLYAAVLSTTRPVMIAPTTPEPRSMRARDDISAGLNPNGSNKFDINAPIDRKAPNGNAKAIARRKKLQFCLKALNDCLKFRASYGTSATADGGFSGFYLMSS